MTNTQQSISEWAQSIGKERAITLAKSEWWKDWEPRDIAIFQMMTRELCMPFGDFHEALEKALGRPVYTHELGLNPDGIWAELWNNKPAPSFEEIMSLIPEEKRILVQV